MRTSLLFNQSGASNPAKGCECQTVADQGKEQGEFKTVENREIWIVENPPMTVNNPFIPQAQATAPFGLLLKDNMLRGKGMPRKKPNGKIMKTATAILTKSVVFMKILKMLVIGKNQQATGR